ncbi:PIN2/TERF1-interacting telomerase inhibitor 1 [Clarias gariepinus]|uniref:PIN2/TERF1-interacting telomerase inhibitor 1 n=1 Tax=Clarias gariepinus TaxID=13013 RepID=UPI00234C914E|nr:PIN2/TERF1-interacting telomerase inhibitor 1 [Clarias gariepinus]
MSMLAEPRRKQKWSVDPRNSAWSNDDSKFGQKMLERMGWSKGKGLGKSEQGATEHIKVKVKNNSLGLGTAVNNEDNWIAHQDDFNQLLAELNNCHGQTSEEPSPEQAQGFSLEEKSKTSKKRVHYMKFTKGKDLSSRSETDLACIFGKRAKQMRNQEEASNSTDSQEEKEQDSDDKNGPLNPEAEHNTVTSTLTMQEYFAQRMAQLKKGRAENGSSASTPDIDSNPRTQSETCKFTEDSRDTSDMEESKKRKKKKKKDRKNDNEEKVEETEDAPVTEVTAVEHADSGSKKKKKKKDRQAREEDTAEECCVPATKQDPVALSSEKKKKRINKETPTCTPNEDDEADNITDTKVLDKKRKKRKQREQEEEQTEVITEKKSKREKRKKKNDN